VRQALLRACVARGDAAAAVAYLRMLPPAGTFASALLKEAAASGCLPLMRAVLQARGRAARPRARRAGRGSLGLAEAQRNCCRLRLSLAAAAGSACEHASTHRLGRVLCRELERESRAFRARRP